MQWAYVCTSVMEKVLKETNASVVGEPYELVWGWKPEHFTRTPQEKWLS